MFHACKFRSTALSFVVLLACGWNATAGASDPDGTTGDELYYGDVLFHFYQQQYFQALTSQMVSQHFDRLGEYDEQAELLKGGLLLSWGQHEQASEIFARLLTETSDQAVRDRANFYLGKVWYQRGYVARARSAFESVSAPLSAELEAERYNLLARVYMDQGDYQAAADLLTGWEGPSIWMAYARYNLGVALVRMDELDVGTALLDQVGMMPAANDEMLALRDRANLALGFAYLQANQQAKAKPVLQRVRINGPFSNKALLGVGWAATADNDYRRALAPWLELSKRDPLDSAVQESLLAVPYAFARLDAQSQAAEYYAKALDVFGTEITHLDQAIADAGNGSLIERLLEQDKSNASGWYWQLAALPDDDQSRYLYFAIADHRFHENLKSYRNLVTLDAHMVQWETKLQAFQDMVDTRQLAYSQRLPAMQERMTEFDLAAMQAHYEDLKQRVADARANNDALALATPAEKATWIRLQGLEQNPAWDSEGAADLRARQRVLKGLLQWDMEREFRLRAWQQERAIEALGHELETTAAAFKSIDAATGSLAGTVAGFTTRIQQGAAEISTLRARIQTSKQQHAEVMNDLLVSELQAQRERLVSYRSQARFALATLYDQLSADMDVAESPEVADD